MQSYHNSILKNRTEQNRTIQFILYQNISSQVKSSHIFNIKKASIRRGNQISPPVPRATTKIKFYRSGSGRVLQRGRLFFVEILAVKSTRELALIVLRKKNDRKNERGKNE